MSELVEATSTRTEEERTILAVIDRGGLAITEHELRHQLARRKIESAGLLERMMDLEERGLIESTLCFRVTQKGIERLPDGGQRPKLAGHRSQWRCRD